MIKFIFKKKIDNILYNGLVLDNQEAEILNNMSKCCIHTLKELTKAYFRSGKSYDKVQVAIYMSSRY